MNFFLHPFPEGLLPFLSPRTHGGISFLRDQLIMALTYQRTWIPHCFTVRLEDFLKNVP